MKPETHRRFRLFSTLLVMVLGALQACSAQVTASMRPYQVQSDRGGRLNVTPLAEFNQPWAMTFLPDRRLLVSEKAGNLLLVELPWDALAAMDEQSNSTDVPVDSSSADPVVRKTKVRGLPEIRAAGQGGMGDVILHPQFADNGLVYISYIEWDEDLSGAVVARGKLVTDGRDDAALENLEIIWRQSPKVTGQGHYSQRLAFSPDGYLFITSGERQKFDPAQDMTQNLGKLIRVLDDGTIPPDNPFATAGGIAAQIWSLGHRNLLGMAFDSNGQLWTHEMGPRGGDELNRIMAGANYGYPLVSDGDHYNGDPIPDHDTRPDLAAPAISWNPVISPSGLVAYSGERFPDWVDTGLIGGLSSQSLVRVTLDVPATEIERYAMGRRIREVEQGPDGRVFLLEDKSGGRLLHIDRP